MVFNRSQPWPPLAWLDNQPQIFCKHVYMAVLCTLDACMRYMNTKLLAPSTDMCNSFMILTLMLARLKTIGYNIYSIGVLGSLRHKMMIIVYG